MFWYVLTNPTLFYCKEDRFACNIKSPIYFYSLWNTSKVLKISICTKKIAKGNLTSAKIKWIVPLAEKTPVPYRAMSSYYGGTWWVFHIISHERFVVMRCFSNQYFWFLIMGCNVWQVFLLLFITSILFKVTTTKMFFKLKIDLLSFCSMALWVNHSENAPEVKQFYLTCLNFLWGCYVKYICSSFFVSALGDIRDSEDLEHIFINRNEQAVATLINRQEKGSGYILSEGNNINQVLAQASTKRPSYGATNITYMNHVSLPPYKKNESFAVN